MPSVFYHLFGTELRLLYLCLRTTPMYWTKEHDHLLVREVLTVDPYSQPKGSRERAKLWEEIASNLNAVSVPRFSVSVRSVRDRVNLVLIKKHKKKVAEESKASGIAVDEPSEFDLGMEEICEKAEAAERDQQMMSEGKKANVEKEKKHAEDMRAKALEKVGETRKRVVCDDGSGEPEKKEKRARRSGTETIVYLKEKSEKEFKMRQEELELKKREQSAQAKQQEEMTQQLIRQQEHQQTMFADLQQQQQQQLQQLSQMQMTIMQQQQQQNQALVAVLQELAKKK